METEAAENTSVFIPISDSRAASAGKQNTDPRETKG